MCLQKITKRYATPDPRVRQAYKIMGKNGYTPFHNNQLTMEWKEATGVLVSDYYDYGARGKVYTSGFHVFPTRKAARQALSMLNHAGGLISQGDFTIRKVEVRDVTYEGTDGTSGREAFREVDIPNLVANWIRLIPGKV